MGIVLVDRQKACLRIIFPPQITAHQPCRNTGRPHQKGEAAGKVGAKSLLGAKEQLIQAIPGQCRRRQCVGQALIPVKRHGALGHFGIRVALLPPLSG